MKILLAEDNAVNRRVALGLLSKRGHRVTVAVNGLEALKAMELESFDIVLMDVQMPEMGGLEATAAIRERERATGTHTRIVALTAHAMKGDQERCLAAGMDGYLVKPIDRTALYAAVEQHDLEVAAFATAVPPEAFDRAELVRLMGDDEHFVQEIIELFREDCPVQLAAIKTAIDQGDAKGLASAAHTLKGTAANLTARRVAEAARALELLGREGLMRATAGPWLHLEREVQQFLAAISGPATRA